MKQIEVERFDFNEKTMEFDKSKVIYEFKDEDVREYDLCTICGFTSYPDCIKFCQNYPGRKRD